MGRRSRVESDGAILSVHFVRTNDDLTHDLFTTLSRIKIVPKILYAFVLFVDRCLVPRYSGTVSIPECDYSFLPRLSVAGQQWVNASEAK